MDDDLDIELRPGADVARRSIIISALLQRISLEEAAGQRDLDVHGAAFDLREWLAAERLGDALTERESLIFSSPLGAIRGEDQRELSWQAEALAALLWSLDRRKLPAPGVPIEVTQLLDMTPQPWDSVTDWVKHAQLLSETKIVRERELAEVWRWRIGAELTRRASPDNEVAIYEQAIRDVIVEARDSGLPVDPNRSDFAVSGRPIRDLATNELDMLAAMADERLRALNWICGFGSSWDDVPLDV